MHGGEEAVASSRYDDVCGLVPPPPLRTEPEISMSLSRRTLLQPVASALASLLLPRSLRTEGRPRFWFLHTETGASWRVDDPVTWPLANAHQPILEWWSTIG